jgi:drug/metabolite transporter (DMT)-like permease
MVVSIALAAAACYAVAMVLQHHGASETDSELSLRLGLVPRLLSRPIWIAGVGANLAGFGLRFAALRHGSLTVVQTALSASLLFALPLSARWHHEHLTRPVWIGASAIAIGLALFLVVASPSSGRAEGSNPAWLATGLGCFTVAGALIWLARSQPDHRAELLAAAGGLLLGVTAGLIKATAAATRSHPTELPRHWQLYALALVGVITVVVVQSAFGAGPLARSLPILMVLEPLASVALGVLVFGEGVHGGLPAHIAQAAGLLVICAGVVLIARSPVIAGGTVDVTSPAVQPWPTTTTTGTGT